MTNGDREGLTGAKVVTVFVTSRVVTHVSDDGRALRLLRVTTSEDASSTELP